MVHPQCFTVALLRLSKALILLNRGFLSGLVSSRSSSRFDSVSGTPPHSSEEYRARRPVFSLPGRELDSSCALKQDISPAVGVLSPAERQSLQQVLGLP